jgi:hypothetical protein
MFLGVVLLSGLLRVVFALPLSEDIKMPTIGLSAFLVSKMLKEVVVEDTVTADVSSSLFVALFEEEMQGIFSLLASVVGVVVAG